MTLRTANTSGDALAMTKSIIHIYYMICDSVNTVYADRNLTKSRLYIYNRIINSTENGRVS